MKNVFSWTFTGLWNRKTLFDVVLWQVKTYEKVILCIPWFAAFKIWSNSFWAIHPGRSHAVNTTISQTPNMVCTYFVEFFGKYWNLNPKHPCGIPQFSICAQYLWAHPLLPLDQTAIAFQVKFATNAHKHHSPDFRKQHASAHCLWGFIVVFFENMVWCTRSFQRGTTHLTFFPVSTQVVSRRSNSMRILFNTLSHMCHICCNFSNFVQKGRATSPEAQSAILACVGTRANRTVLLSVNSLRGEFSWSFQKRSQGQDQAWVQNARHHCSPRVCVGFLVFVVHPRPSPCLAFRRDSLRHNSRTLSHTILLHNSLTHNSLTHNLLTHNSLTHNLLTHNSLAHNSHTQLPHTQLSHTQLSHTQLAHTQLSHSLTHNSATHNPTTHNLLTRNSFTQNSLTHNSLTHNSHTPPSHTTLSHTTLSHTTLSLSHTQLPHTQLAHTQLPHTQLSHTLVQNCRCEFGCGVHLTCKTPTIKWQYEYT